MTTDSADYRSSDRAETIEEQLHRKGVQPIRSIHDLACPGAFESDEELEEFLEFTYASRRAGTV